MCDLAWFSLDWRSSKVSLKPPAHPPTHSHSLTTHPLTPAVLNPHSLDLFKPSWCMQASGWLTHDDSCCAGKWLAADVGDRKTVRKLLPGPMPMVQVGGQ